MADLEDITGWREEFWALEEGEDDDEWQAYQEWYERHWEATATVPQVLAFADAVLKNDEIREAAQKKLIWDEYLSEHGPFIDGDPEWENRFPREELRLLSDFTDWFCWKAKFELAVLAFYNGGVLAAALVAVGRLPGIHTPETKDYLLTTWGGRILPDVEGQDT